jgi:SNF2 family DNA or RNA helicase
MPKRKLPYRFKETPYAHQLTAWDISKDRASFALFMEMGTGKTKVVIDTAAYLFDKGEIDAVLVFSNKGSFRNWVTVEIPKHIPTHVKYKAYAWDNRPTKKAKRELVSFATGNWGLKFFAMNIEALAHKRSAAIANRFVQIHKCLMVIDESTTIKNYQAKRTRAAIIIGRIARYRRILTGMAITNSPLDVYSQCTFLGPSLLGFSSFTAFRAHFAYLEEMRNAQRAYKVVVGYKNLEDLTRRLNKFAYIVKSDDCLDLPPQTWEEYEVELTDEQKRIYVDLRDRSIAELENEKVVSAQIVLTKLLRLHQVVCGHVRDEDGVDHDIPNNRLSALDAVLDETENAIIWANYRYDIERLVAHLREKYDKSCVAHYYGDTTEDEREAAKTDFQSGKVRYLVMNPRTGAHGLTLVKTNLALYFSNTYDLELRAQSEKRCHRIGQTRAVTYVDFVARKTVDEKILKSLRTKRALSDRVLVSNWREIF